MDGRQAQQSLPALVQVCNQQCVTHSCRCVCVISSGISPLYFEPASTRDTWLAVLCFEDQLMQHALIGDVVGSVLL